MRIRRTARLRVESLEARALLSTYYVAPNGVNGQTGDSANPWATLQYAAGRVQAGDTVVVRAGNYVGFNLTRDGTAAAPITFRAEPGVTVDRPNTWNNLDGINLEGASYAIVEGFKVINQPRTGIRSVTNDHVIIRNNTCDANGTWGILTGFSDDLLIENNVTTRSGAEHGIYVSNSGDRPVIRGNTIWGNRANGIHMNGDRFQGGDGIISGALVENNVIYDNGRGGGSGINCDGVQASTIRNNLLYGNHASGISLYRIDGGGGSSNNVVVNNTVVQASDGRWALNIQSGSTGNTVRNNILYNNHPSRGSIDISSDSLPGFTSDYNVVMSRFTTNGGNSVISLASWQGQTGQDTRSVVATPAQLFVNVGANDYHLSATSPAKDKGTSAFAPAADLEGRLRPSGPGYDIGAYELQQGGAPQPPVANPDGYTVVHGRTLTINPAGVLANDTSPSGLPLTAARVSGPARGTLTLNANGSFTYTPTAGYVGGDSFTYTASDGQLTSSPATVTITMTDQAPTAGNNSYQTPAGVTLSISAPGVLGNDSDPDGDPLTAVLVSGPAQGTLTLNANGSFAYTPAAGYSGPDSFTYRANDGAMNSNVATVSITVTAPTPPPPVASPDSYGVLHDRTLQVGPAGVLANDSSPSGRPLTATLVGGPANGSLTLNPDGSFAYTPFPGFVGTDSFTYKAGDGLAFSAPTSVALSVIDAAPSAGNDSYRVARNTTLNVPAAGVLANDSDADGDALRAVLVSGPAHGTVTLNANGSFTYTPARGYLGADGFTYRANDGALNSNVATVSISVVRPRQVASVQVNDGSGQRSMVTSLTVTFDGLASLPSNPADAFRLTGPAGAVALNASVGTDAGGERTRVTLTFAGSGLKAGSLADGRYTLTVIGEQVRDDLGQAGDDHTFALHRLFGDSDGDGDVDSADLKRFKAALNKKPGASGYAWYFDYDAAGGVTRSVDLNQFMKRLGKRV